MIRHKHSIVIYEENYNVTKNVGLFQTTIARQNQHYHGTKKSSNDNNSNVRNNNMMQIRKIYRNQRQVSEISIYQNKRDKNNSEILNFLFT